VLSETITHQVQADENLGPCSRRALIDVIVILKIGIEKRPFMKKWHWVSRWHSKSGAQPYGFMGLSVPGDGWLCGRTWRIILVLANEWRGAG
jgi:hypothetical protein